MSFTVLPYSIITAVLAIAFFIITLRQYLRGRIGFKPLLFWESLWIVLFITGIIPEIFEFITVFLGMAIPIHFITTSSIILLFIFTFLLYQKINDVDKKIVRIVQYMAIVENKSKKHRK